MMLTGLITSNITTIEMGNCLGIGAYEANGSTAPLTDIEYLDLVQPYLEQAEIGMFVGVRNVNEETVALAASNGLHFLRLGANAGDGKDSVAQVKMIKDANLHCRYAAMKGYIVSARELAEEAKMLCDAGLDGLTIMDSAGTMTPKMVDQYVSALVAAVPIPIGFHGHNNLGLSVANGLVAAEAGAKEIDCGLLGMARSAGNCATELISTVLQMQGDLMDVDLLKLLHFLDEQLIPAMARHGYHPPVSPVDLVYGLAGCHSSFASRFTHVAEQAEVDLFELIIEVSKQDRKAPSQQLIESVAATLAKE
jgi:4-hydroxy 2-oxovalerate aldolase